MKPSGQLMSDFFKRFGLICLVNWFRVVIMVAGFNWDGRELKADVKTPAFGHQH